MAGHLDKALLQMAGFEPESDLYAKAGSNLLFPEDFQVGKTGLDYRQLRDLKNDAANWGFKNGDSRIHALLYAWAKDNPDEQITPEVIDRLNYLARTADSMNVSGRRFWQNGSVGENRNTRALIEQMQANPEKANEILKAKGFSKYNSPIQNYFAWAEQFMLDDPDYGSTVQNNISRNISKSAGDFADNLNLASAKMLEKELVPAVTNEIAKQSNLDKAEKQLEAAKAKKLQDAEDEENLRRAGYGFMFDPNFKNDKSIPDEWL